MAKKANLSVLVIILLVAIGPLTACRPQLRPISMTPSASPAIFPSASIEASKTATPTATQTIAPSATFTPGPSPGLEGPLSGISYVIPLTILHSTESSLTLYFELQDNAVGNLFYRPASASGHDGPWQLYAGDGSARPLEIGGLSSGLEYEFAVGIHDGLNGYSPPQFLGAAWDPVLAKTCDESTWPLRVGVVGDSGFGESITKQLAERMASYELDLMLHTGDVVYRVHENASPAEAFAMKYYQPFELVLKRMPVYPVLGNHEYDAAAMHEGLPYYEVAFPFLPDADMSQGGIRGTRHWYAVTHGPIQFVMLNSQVFYQAAEERAEQDTWLRERLADERYRVTIVVFHVPPFTSGLHATDGRPVKANWVPYFEASNVPLVLSGHDHNYERLEVNGITYIVTGGGSSVLYPISNRLPESQIFARETHFVLLEIYVDHLDLFAINYEGLLLDEATIAFSER